MPDSLSLTPNISGAVTQQLNSRSPWYIDQAGFDMPVVEYDEQYAESIDTEGARRVRSRPINPTGSIPLLLNLSTSGTATILSHSRQLQQTVEACRRYGGSMTYTLDTTWGERNLLPDSSFESGTGWNKYENGGSGGTLVWDTSYYHSGAQSIKVTAGTGNNDIGVVGPSVVADRPACAPGDVFTVSAYVNLGGTIARQARPIIAWYTAADAHISSTSGAATTVTDTGWVRVAAVMNAAPATAAKAAFYLAINAPGNGEIFYIDDFQAERGNVLTDYAPKAGEVLGGDAVTYDLESIRVSDLPQNERQFGIVRPVIDFTCRPYGRLAPVSLVSNSIGGTADPVQSVSLADITGSAEALVQATISDTATQARNFAEVAIDDDWDGSAPLYYDNVNLTAVAASTTNYSVSGAFGGSVKRATLATTPLGVVERTAMTHRGRHLAKARVKGAGTGPIYLRAAYRTGAGAWSRTPWQRLPLLDDFAEVALGRVTGTGSGLTVRIEAYSDTSGDTLEVDYLMMMPTSKYLKLKGAISSVNSLTAWDRFAQTAGTLTGKVATTGGTWIGAGDADDFNVTGALDPPAFVGAYRNAADAAVYSGRHATLGTATFTDLEVRGILRHEPLTAEHFWGFTARYVDTSNWIAWGMYHDSSMPAYQAQLRVYRTVGGTMTRIYNSATSVYFGPNMNHPMSLAVASTGHWSAKWQEVEIASGYESVLATGGTLASGKCGLYDGSAEVVNDRFWDEFSVSVPDAQTVIPAGGTIVIDHDSVARSDGTRPPVVEGSYLRVPPAGREGRTSRLAVKLRRADTDGAPDTPITSDTQRVDVTVTPRVVLL